VLSGTPNTAGIYTFLIRALDVVTGGAAARAFTLNVTAARDSRRTRPCRSGTWGTAILAEADRHTGGTGALAWALQHPAVLAAGADAVVERPPQRDAHRHPASSRSGSP